MMLDTHKAVETLVAVWGDKKKYAEAIVDIINQKYTELATKEDIKGLRKDMKIMETGLRAEIGEVKSDIKWLKGLMFVIAAMILGLWFK